MIEFKGSEGKYAALIDVVGGVFFMISMVFATIIIFCC